LNGEVLMKLDIDFAYQEDAGPLFEEGPTTPLPPVEKGRSSFVLSRKVTSGFNVTFIKVIYVTNLFSPKI
jgi:hypothetical protein